MTSLIRRIRSDDAAALRVIRLRALATDPLSFGSTFASEAARDDAFWLARATTAASGAEVATFLAFVDDVVVGTSTIRRDETDARTFGVFGVWVAPEARRLGIARALLASAELFARDGGGARLALMVTERATAAAALYLSSGFAPTGLTEPSERDDMVETELAKPLTC
ncbi:MAG TPA: GNAT family N-acetyltransferase [Myxococcota bacterium]|jgi:ribosomal protein S18 acetylase RimI-like enzyme